MWNNVCISSNSFADLNIGEKQRVEEEVCHQTSFLTITVVKHILWGHRSSGAYHNLLAMSSNTNTNIFRRHLWIKSFLKSLSVKEAQKTIRDADAGRNAMTRFESWAHTNPLCTCLDGSQQEHTWIHPNLLSGSSNTNRNIFCSYLDSSYLVEVSAQPLPQVIVVWRRAPLRTPTKTSTC